MSAYFTGCDLFAEYLVLNILPLFPSNRKKVECLKFLQENSGLSKSCRLKIKRKDALFLLSNRLQEYFAPLSVFNEHGTRIA
jgi:hypothetical protein